MKEMVVLSKISKTLSIRKLVGLKSFSTSFTFGSREKEDGKHSEHFHSTHIEHIASLDVLGTRTSRRKAGIVCTIGPASRDVEILVEMIESGMNIARLNFSHGTTEYHLETLKNIRKANDIINEKYNRVTPIGIALDTKGPEIRTGWVKGGMTAEIELKRGDEISLTTDEKYSKEVTTSMIYVDYKNMPRIVLPESLIYIDDGLISLKVLTIDGVHIKCIVEIGGKLGSSKGVNLPGTKIDLPALSEKDKKDIRFAIDNNLDIIFASFIRDDKAVAEIKEITRVHEDVSSNISVIAKIENQQGMENIDEIIAAADGIMVARGDLGIEMPLEKIFLAQKSMIAKCNLAGKPIICATQMLESMVFNPRPTRAETSDVANAVLDGTDCVMLSGETAKGKFPTECVRVMSKVCREAEAAVPYRQLFIDLSKMIHPPAAVDLSTALASVAAAEKSLAAAIIVLTTTGKSAHLVSKFRPKCPIIAVTRDIRVARKAHLFRGVIPILHTKEPLTDWSKDLELTTKTGLLIGKFLGVIAEGDNIIVLTGWRAGKGSTNTMKIVKVSKELLQPGSND